MDALRERGVETDAIRLADHTIEPGVVSEAVTDADEWPAIRDRILAADILVVATPTWIGQPSSIAKRALVDIGYTVPGQAWTYWNKGPGPGEEEWLTTDEREWTISTARTAAQNLHATAEALQAAPIPAPPGG